VPAHAFRKSAGLLDDEKRLETGRARFAGLRLARARQHFDEIRRECIACPTLGASQNPFVAVPHRARLNASKVGAGCRFGKRDGADPFTLRGTLQKLEPAVVIERLRAEPLTSRQDAADGEPRAR
jgi:hypothetical protein